jgi:hypothetical protein
MSHRFKSAYGIDSSDRHIVIVRARGGSSFETLAVSDSSKVPEGLRRQIDNDVAGGRASSAAALACHESVLRRVSAPFRQLDRAMKVLPSMLDVQLPFPLEQCAYMLSGASPNTSGGIDALAIAARRDDVQHALQRLGEAGVDPVFLDHEGLALWWQLRRDFSDSNPSGRVLVHLGPAHTTLAYGRGRDLFGAHSMRLGGIDASPAEIASRIQSWLRAQTALVITSQTEWFFSGAGAVDASRTAEMRQSLAAANARIVADPATFLARALAARARQGDEFSCNLRTGEQQHALARSLGSSQPRRVMIAAVAASLLLCSVNIVVLFAFSKRNDDAQRAIQKLALELSGEAAPKGQESLVVVRALDEKTSALLPFQRMFAPTMSRRLGEILSLCRTNSATVSRLVLRPDSLHVEMTASTSFGADRIVSALRFAGWQFQPQRRDAMIVIEAKR